MKLDETLDLIDYMVLTVYRGGLDEKFIGGEMPTMTKILSLFTLVFTSEEIP